MHAVRKRILELLKETGGATVAELATALDMAPVSVRHHLDILQGDGLICVDRVARKGSVGRPQQIYALTSEANRYFPDDFAALAGRLVVQLKLALPPEQVTSAFCAMARETAAEMSCDDVGPSDLTLEGRLERITAFLTERGYLASWEADENGDYLLHKHNCPYAGISGQHDELCHMDQVLIDTLLDQPCLRVESMDSDNRCTYRIGVGDKRIEHAQLGVAPITFATYEGQQTVELAPVP